ncbi:hypothetical protein TIFTF001_001420 [Ficus carica]|uniref:Lactoylglutathione lyase n=1 Tax=Ficus carica TaxID=3494 RepID=A0AA88CRM4_FICCA|nr:hypothetical protein TIFTF001_001420 [Ficus carica]
MNLVMRKLEEMNIEYVTAVVEEGGITVDQLFFHDPDGYMIEICNCQNLPVLPLSSCPLKLPRSSSNSNANAKCKSSSSYYGKRRSEMQCSGEAATLLMMENLLVEMMNMSI